MQERAQMASPRTENPKNYRVLWKYYQLFSLLINRQNEAKSINKEKDNMKKEKADVKKNQKNF